MNDNVRKPILCLDFDGVIHAYSRGWQDGAIYDDVVPGFFDWAMRAERYFTLTIYSSRTKHPDGVAAMTDWLRAQVRKWLTSRVDIGLDLNTHTEHVMTWFAFAHEKPPAFLTIDDRGMQFRGDWTVNWLDPEHLINFKPWNVK